MPDTRTDLTAVLAELEALRHAAEFERENTPLRVQHLEYVTALLDHAPALLAAARERDALRELLREAQESVCSLKCPSVKRTGEPWTHSDLCSRITRTLNPNAPQKNPRQDQCLCGGVGCNSCEPQGRG